MATKDSFPLARPALPTKASKIPILTTVLALTANLNSARKNPIWETPDRVPLWTPYDVV